MNEVKSKIENALKNQVIKINALKIRPTNSGKIALEVASAENEEAINQLNTEVTGYTAKEIPKKYPRLIIKNIPNDMLPSDIIETINTGYTEINNIENKEMKVVTVLKSNRWNGSSVIIQVSPNVRKILIKSDKVKLGMCVYPIEDYVQLMQCYKCWKFGHLAAHCHNPVYVCGICSQSHDTKTCQYYNIRKTGLEEYLELENKTCSNCANNKKHKASANSHGASDLLTCPFDKEQRQSYQRQIEYDC